ncbi:ribonuclease H-like domain, reverse transcriptase, RNA-dependent DNA polymerase [Tanacetum coccineum]
MLRLQRLGSNTETGVTYTEEEIMAIVQKGKQRGHLSSVGRVLPRCATNRCPPLPQSIVDPVDVEKLKKSNKSLTKQVKMMRLFRSDDKFSQMLDFHMLEILGTSAESHCLHDRAGSVLEVDEILAKGKLYSAFAIVKPPGHHAEKHEPMRFCVYNQLVCLRSKDTFSLDSEVVDEVVDEVQIHVTERD